MNDSGTGERTVFPSLPSERFKAFLEVAGILRAAGVNESGWRRQLARAFADRYAIDEYRAYNAIGILGLECLDQIRVACLGEEGAMRSIQNRRPKDGIPRRASRDPQDFGETNEQRELRQLALYTTALKQLASDERNRESLAGALARPLSVVDSFLFQHPELAKQLTDGLQVFRFGRK